jgi:hypothetical protein
VVRATIKTKPPDATHCSVRAMAASQNVSPATVQRIWKKHKLQPHRLESFKFSNDPDFAPKVRDIVGLYVNPPEKAIVLSVDEKSRIQTLDRTQPILPLRPGLLERQTHDYQRHGTTTLFAALNVLEGTITGDANRVIVIRSSWRYSTGSISPSIPLSTFTSCLTTTAPTSIRK